MTSYFDNSRVKKLQDNNKDYNNYKTKRLPKAKHSKPKKSSHSSNDLAFPRHQASVCTYSAAVGKRRKHYYVLHTMYFYPKKWAFGCFLLCPSFILLLVLISPKKKRATLMQRSAAFARAVWLYLVQVPTKYRSYWQTAAPFSHNKTFLLVAFFCTVDVLERPFYLVL